MASFSVAKFQIGKAGITQGVLDALTLVFKTHKNVRISVLKSSGRDKSKIVEMADELRDKLPGRYVYRIIGFTIILQRRSGDKEKIKNNFIKPSN